MPEKTKQTLVHMPEELMNKLTDICRERGLNKSSLIVAIIEENIDSKVAQLTKRLEEVLNGNKTN